MSICQIVTALAFLTTVAVLVATIPVRTFLGMDGKPDQEEQP